MHVREAEQLIGGSIAWLCDSMDNDLKHALGNAPNCEFVIDPDGNIARMRVWSRPDELRADLEELVGPVDDPTDPGEVQVRFRPPPSAAPTRVLQPFDVPRGMTPLVVTPDVAASPEPFYAKLRVEAEPELLQRGKGRMYLRFQMDPLYHVHWNNLAAPLTFEIASPDGVRIDPPRGEAPQPDEPADSDPREFLLHVDLCEPGPILLTARYFACNDEAGWCKPVEQSYTIEWRTDRDGGWAQRRR